MKLKVLSTVGLALSLGLTSLGSDGTAFAENLMIVTSIK